MADLIKLPSLYEISAEYRAALEELGNLDLDDQTVADTLSGISGMFEAKAVNVAAFLRNLEATADAIKEAEGTMAKRRKAIENRAAAMKKYILDNMLAVGITKIECPLFKIAVRDNPPSVVIDDAEKLPGLYMRIPDPPPPTPDKTAIGKMLKLGTEVPGAHLEQSQRLEIK